MDLQNAYYFHVVFLALQPVAHGMRKERQSAAQSGEEKELVNSPRFL
jgi:hypothetical protein